MCTRAISACMHALTGAVTSQHVSSVVMDDRMGAAPACRCACMVRDQAVHGSACAVEGHALAHLSRLVMRLLRMLKQKPRRAAKMPYAPTMHCEVWVSDGSEAAAAVVGKCPWRHAACGTSTLTHCATPKNATSLPCENASLPQHPSQPRTPVSVRGMIAAAGCGTAHGGFHT